MPQGGEGAHRPLWPGRAVHRVRPGGYCAGSIASLRISTARAAHSRHICALGARSTAVRAGELSPRPATSPCPRLLHCAYDLPQKSQAGCSLSTIGTMPHPVGQRNGEIVVYRRRARRRRRSGPGCALGQSAREGTVAGGRGERRPGPSSAAMRSSTATAISAAACSQRPIANPFMVERADRVDVVVQHGSRLVPHTHDESFEVLANVLGVLGGPARGNLLVRHRPPEFLEQRSRHRQQASPRSPSPRHACVSHPCVERDAPEVLRGHRRPTAPARTTASARPTNVTSQR